MHQHSGGGGGTQDLTMISSLCRICLETGATIPIFGDVANNCEDLQGKLSLCMGQQIPDLYGYPRNICQKCLNIVNETIIFINMFNESCAKIKTMISKVNLIECYSGDGGNNDAYKILEPEVCMHDCSSVMDDTTQYEDHTLPKIKKTKRKQKIAADDKIKKSSKKKNTSSHIEGNDNLKMNKNIETLWETEKELNEKVLKTKHKSRIKNDKKEKKLPCDEPTCCEYCGKAYTDRSFLSRHISIYHKVEKPYDCPTCSKTFSTTQLLNRHIKRVHSQEKNCICSECGKAFVGRSELGSHYKSSHLKRPCPKRYACKICGKLYTTFKSAITHERSTHTGERPAVCNVCDARFYHEDYLKIHMRLHTGETPYKCPICSKGFSQNANMKSHIRHNHSISQMDEITLKSLHPRFLKYMKP